jgi:hypothetical protein
MSTHIEPRTLKLPRAFKLIAPFLVVIMLWMFWVFFFTIDRDYQVGTIIVSAFGLAALWSHANATRTLVTVNDEGIAVRNAFGKKRSARWSEVDHCSFHNTTLTFHLETGRPIRVSMNLEGFQHLLHALDARGLR